MCWLFSRGILQPFLPCRGWPLGTASPTLCCLLDSSWFSNEGGWALAWDQSAALQLPPCLLAVLAVVGLWLQLLTYPSLFLGSKFSPGSIITSPLLSLSIQPRGSNSFAVANSCVSVSSSLLGSLNPTHHSVDSLIIKFSSFKPF